MSIFSGYLEDEEVLYSLEEEKQLREWLNDRENLRGEILRWVSRRSDDVPMSLPVVEKMLELGLLPSATPVDNQTAGSLLGLVASVIGRDQLEEYTKV